MGNDLVPVLSVPAAWSFRHGIQACW